MGATIAAVIEGLEQTYGRPAWHRRYDALDELIYTVLSQNTADVNSQRAFTRLKERFPRWEDVLIADDVEIAEAIRWGGLAQIKAPRIRRILRTILDDGGPLGLSFLATLPLDEAKKWLRKLPGVGPKTAACVLLFAFGRPVLPVDTHVYRVAKRLGLIDAQVNVERSHDLLEGLVPQDEFYAFHVNMVRHGREVCHAQRPRCNTCVLRQVCPSQWLGS